MHALADAIKNPANAKWQNGTLVVCVVKNSIQMLTVLNGLEQWSPFPPATFREPDIGNELTAIACLSDGKPFKKLKLY